MRHSQQRGWAVLALLSLLLLMLTLGHLMLLTQAQQQIQLQKMMRGDYQAQAAAYSGLNHALVVLQKNRSEDITPLHHVAPTYHVQFDWISKKHVQLTAQGWSARNENQSTQRIEAIWHSFLKKPLERGFSLFDNDNSPWAWSNKRMTEVYPTGFMYRHDCHALHGLLILVQGHCLLTQDLGQATQPVLLLVVGGDLVLEHSSRVYGVAGVFSHTPVRIQIPQAAQWIGAIASQVRVDASEYRGLIFSKDIVEQVQRFGQWSWVNGSWHRS